MVQKGLLNKEKFYIPKDQVESYETIHCVLGYMKQRQNQNLLENIHHHHYQDKMMISSSQEKHRILLIKLTQGIMSIFEQPYVKEEVVIKKKPVTETKTLSDQVTSEVRIKGSSTEDEA